MNEHLLALMLPLAWLVELWYVTLPLLLLAGWGIHSARKADPGLSLPPLAILLAWPAGMIICGGLFTNFDRFEGAGDWYLWLMMAVLGLALIGSLVHCAVIAREAPQLRMIINFGAFAYLWLCLVCAGANVILLSGLGRNWN